MRHTREIPGSKAPEDFFLGEHGEEELDRLAGRAEHMGRLADAQGGLGGEIARASGGTRDPADGRRAVAIVGVSGFFPGSRSIEEFCRSLEEQRSLFGPVPANHFCAPAIAGRRGAFIEDIAGFDHEAFNLGAREARYMDPRLRLLLMAAWHTFEDAGVRPTRLKDAIVDVLIASEESAYGEFVASGELLPYTPIAASSWSLPNRVSHAFGLTGKSLLVNAACAGGSAALHLGMRSLRSGEADYVLVGAANLLYGQAASMAFLGQESLGILADVEGCCPFQSNAKGFLPAESVVTVLLRRLEDAIADGDPVHGVLLGSHMNHVGGQGALTAPRAAAQADAIVRAYEDAGIHPATVTYIEAHGACNVFGDTEELEAFKASGARLAAGAARGGTAACKVSSIKPNIGHANSASGLVSLVRALHALKSRTRFGIRGFAAESALPNLAGSRFFVEADSDAWERTRAPDGAEVPRRAAINNFGVGGVNVHILLEEGPDGPPDSGAPAQSVGAAPYFLAASAPREERLVNVAETLLEWLEREGSVDAAQLEALSVMARSAFRHRIVFRFDDVHALLEKLRKFVHSGGTSGYFLKGDSTRRSKASAMFQSSAKLAQFLDELNEDSDKRALFDLWCEGFDAPLERFLARRNVGKRPLPKFPFQMHHIWLEPAEPSQDGKRRRQDGGVAHPLLHENISDLGRVRYLAAFSGSEPFIDRSASATPSRVGRGGLLLSMAWEAARRAIGPGESAGVPVGLEAVEWPSPFAAASGDGIYVTIFGGNDEVGFEIEDDEDLLLCAGRVALGERAGTGPRIDLGGPGERAPCGLEADCSESFKGDVTCRVEQLSVSEREVLAHLSLSDALARLCDSVALHPILIDRAIAIAGSLVERQSAVEVGRHAGPTVMCLRQLGRLEFKQELKSTVWVRVALEASARPGEPRFRIDLAADDGTLCARLLDVEIAAPASESGRAEDVRHPDGTRLILSQSGQEVNGSAAASVAQELAQIVADVLGTARETVHRDADLSSVGFDSISLGLLAKRLSEQYGLEISPTLFFRRPTLMQVAEHLVAQLAAPVRRNGAAGEPAQVTQSGPAASSRPPDSRAGKQRRNSRQRGAPASGREPIAVIGMSGRFPQASSVEAMWQLLAEGREAVTRLSVERLGWPSGELAYEWSGTLDGVAEFDASFFEISPREAERMDPRQRLLLQEAWNALEDAACGPAHLGGGNIGMFVGTEPGQYQHVAGSWDSITDNSDSVLAARLAYFLDLSGPNMAINTACSSGLVAAHQACVALRNRECDGAIVAAVNLLLTPDLYVGMKRAGMLSPDGKCFAFDRRANGMVPGEAVVALVLKRLSDALRDGDPVHATIRGSGINYDGKTNGITAPNGLAQARLLRSVYERYRIDPDEIEYIVAHGTGTRLGDPVEVEALCAAFATYTQRRQYCALTSSKTNFGHTFAASGLVSLVCLIQALRHELIPPSLHCEQESELIDWAGSPFFVNKSARPWSRREGAPRLGAVSAFGMSGTNAHMVVQCHD